MDGHIKGAIQWETEKFHDPTQVDALIDGPLKGKSQVIVHCMLSQKRGPMCASKLLERLQERGIVAPDVTVMAGGWERFASVYGGNQELIEATKSANQGSEAS
jgi:Cdc25 family phosphatase